MNTRWTAALPADGGALPLQQTLLEARVAELDAHKRRFGRQVTARKLLAYALNAISIFGGIVVAAKISWLDQTALGITIAAAIGIEKLTSNHARLLAMAEAQHACDRLRAKVVKRHSEALPALLALRDSRKAPDRARFEPEFSDLMTGLLKELHDGQEVILEAVRQADLKALSTLYMDDKA